MRNESAKETETGYLELEKRVSQCSNMIINLNMLKFSRLYLDKKDTNRIKDLQKRKKEEGDIICERTKKPCLLYHSDYFEANRLDMCPSSEESVKRYKLAGIKEGNYLFVFEASRIEDN